MAGGRQREFDKYQALDDAMHVFWKKGFTAASLTDLTGAMGINKPSMYATFGNKEKLFVQATEHYIEHYAKSHVYLLHEDKPLPERLNNYLMSVIGAQCSLDGPKGCYISLCVSESASESIPEGASEMMEHARDFAENFLTGYFTNEIKNRTLSAATDAAVLARFVVAILHGTAAMARGGKTIEDFEPVVATVVSTLNCGLER